MELKIYNKIITAPIEDIIKKLREETNYRFFSSIKNCGDNIAVTCPHHKDGKETHPSCYIFNNRNDDEVEYGKVKCFTCGYTVPLYTMIGHLFNADDEFGKEWLNERFGNVFVEYEETLPEITLKKNDVFLNESILDEYVGKRHPYMYERKLTDEVMDYFKIGFDESTNSIVFPVWNENGKLVMLSRRCVDKKRFDLAQSVQKPIYLLNFIKKLKYTKVFVVESQIDALTLWSWGYPAVALFGCGCKSQYEILKRSGIREYILCFDGDNAGRNATRNFIRNLRGTVFISYVDMPDGFDINDLTKEQFNKLPLIYS